MRGWKDLEVVETIYEEDHEEECYSSSSSSLLLTPFTSLNTSLESTVRAWSLATRHQTDVLIKVQDQFFHLHKDPLMLRSGYLKRHLKESSAITLTPPLNITAETFSSIVDFCYSSHIVITPFNVAALRLAAELLNMKEEDGNGKSNCNGDENLLMKTENYFCQAISVNRDYAVTILRSCLALLPESEETASLASRCIEALGLLDCTDGVNSWIDDVKSLAIEKFQIIVDSMHNLLTGCHDLLYRIVDVYLEEHGKKITEEEKTKICSSVDCEKLSPNLIIHAVQNPRMPLRFVVRAMFVEQLYTHHSIISNISNNPNSYKQSQQNKKNNKHKEITFGSILQGDAALRQVALLKASVEATTSKIQSLEKQVIDVKKLLNDQSEKKRDNAATHIDSSRSASFRFSSENKIERGEKGSTSLVSFSSIDGGHHDDQRDIDVLSSSSSSSSSYHSTSEKLKTGKNFGWKLIMKGLRSKFWKSSSKSTAKSVPMDNTDRTGMVSKKNLNGDHGDVDENLVRDVFVIKREG